MAHAYLIALALSFMDDRSFTLGEYMYGFSTFCNCGLDLDPITLTHIPWRYIGCANINFLCQGFRKLSSDRQTDKQTYTIEIYYTTPLRGWSMENKLSHAE